MKVQYQCTRYKRPEFNALGQYKNVPFGTFGLISAYNNVTNKVTASKTELALPIAMEFSTST
jgi:hypothetical protein